MHVLFDLDRPLAIPEKIWDEALVAAQELVEMCLQHAAFLAGCGDIGEAVEMYQKLSEGTLICAYVTV